MAYVIKARFYCGLDQTGESYIITSDNSEVDTKLEVGRHVMLREKYILPCGNCQDPKPGKMVHVIVKGGNSYCVECGRLLIQVEGS